MLTTSITLHRKPKDGTSVTIISKSVTYQISASGTEKPTDIWSDKVVLTTDTKPYLWTRTIVVYSDTNYTTSYSVSYRGKDGTNGTSFTPKGTATGFFYNMSSVPSYEDGMDSDVYIVNVDDRSNPTSKLPPYVCHFEHENFIIEHAEFGDGYNVKGHLYVANSNKWVDFGEIQGAKGDPGDPGIDAINIVFSPAELVFDADENGNLKQAEKSAEVKVFRGNKQLTYLTDWYFPNVGGKQPGDNCKAAFMVEGNNSPFKPIVKIYDISSTDIVGTNPQAKVPASSGGINVPIKVNDITYNAYLSFAVNVNTFAHTLIQDNKKYISKYTEISNKYNTLSNELNGKASKDELMEVSSSIEQTAREISLSVSEKSVGRRNMLIGSACRKYGDGFVYMSGGYYDGYPLEQIEKNSGINGVNCIHCRTKQAGTGSYYLSGFRWHGISPQGNIKLEMGKNYVLSFYAKTHTPDDIVFLAEVLYQGSKIDTSRPAGYAGPTGYSTTFSASEADKWELFTVKVSVPSDAPYEYVEINIFARARSYSFVGGYICKPMLEEGENYNGWTLSEQDYDYIGGNMLDNTLSLDKSGTLYEVNGTLTTAGFGESTSIYKSFAYKLKGIVDSFSQLPTYGNVYNDTYYVRNEGTCYAYNGSNFENVGNDYYYNILEWRKGKSGEFIPFGLEANKDYVFSFMAKGTGKITAYFHEPYTDVFVESSLGAIYTEVDGYADFQLTNEWRRYWVHWRPSDSLHKYILLRLNRSFNSDGSAPITDCYIAQPKLEDGATMTEFTERKTDLVDKTTMKKAGIEITTNQIKLYGDKVQVLTRKDENSEYVEAGMFVNGKLNANLIDADKIEVKHLWAKSEDGTNKVGYFGNYEIEACKVNNANAPLFVGADTAAKSPFYVTNNGHMVSTSATLGCFSLDKMSLRYISGYDDEEPGFALYNNYMLFREYSRTFNPDTHTWKSERKRTVWLGEFKTAHQVPALLSNLLIDDSFSVNGDTLKSGIRISVKGCDDSQQYDNPTYNLSNAVYGNFAIYAEHGMYGGLRPMTRKINRSMELTDMDCFVIVTKGVTLTLPAKPQRGQYYKFLQVGDNFVIKSSSNNMYWKGADGVRSFTSGTYNQTTELIYDGGGWRVNWFREASV